MKLTLSTVIVFILSFIYYIFYNDESHWYNLSDNKKMSFIDCVTYTFTCWFTLGYGEVIPKSPVVKISSVVIIFLAYIVILI